MEKGHLQPVSILFTNPTPSEWTCDPFATFRKFRDWVMEHSLTPCLVTMETPWKMGCGWKSFSHIWQKVEMEVKRKAMNEKLKLFL